MYSNMKWNHCIHIGSSVLLSVFVYFDYTIAEIGIKLYKIVFYILGLTMYDLIG